MDSYTLSQYVVSSFHHSLYLSSLVTVVTLNHCSFGTLCNTHTQYICKSDIEHFLFLKTLIVCIRGL